MAATLPQRLADFPVCRPAGQRAGRGGIGQLRLCPGKPERPQSIGINFVYTHNYGCEPGAISALSEILRAADDVGMLVAMSQPHFSHYDWRGTGADETNGYSVHATYYARAAQNHPSVVAYALSHNATGYEEDMNPDLMDAQPAPRDRWSRNNAAMALRAEAIVKRLDPGRVVYHHASGNLGSMHTINFYPNFVPVQELSDWFGHWAAEGVKPMFTCEYGAPFTWDWTMYRGCTKERGWQRAGAVGILHRGMERAVPGGLRLSHQCCRGLQPPMGSKTVPPGSSWHRWDYPHPVGSRVFAECDPVLARYYTDNWRAFRTWGVSGISPWEHDHLWKLRDGVTGGAANSRWTGTTCNGRGSVPITSAQPTSGWIWPSSAPIDPSSRGSTAAPKTVRCLRTGANRPGLPARTAISCRAKRWRNRSLSSITRVKP